MVLMDLHMPVMDGATATRQLLHQQPTCRVIMLTTFDDEESRARGRKAGAVAYLLKDTPLDELVEAIRMEVAA
jgi:DNA-binding NarL/FixJ family response regulator